MDSQSTPIESLNSQDDSQAVNNVLAKFNNLQIPSQPSGGGSTSISELPPINREIPKMEQQFENRNLNQEMYSHSSQNVAYENDYNNEMRRVSKYGNRAPQQDQYEDDDEYEYEDEMVVDEVPLWKKVLNEIRIPLFIMIVALIFFNKKFEKTFVKSVTFFGNQFNEVNIYGFVVLCFIVAIISYLMIRFIRF